MHSMSSSTYLTLVVVAAIIGLVVYYWPERTPTRHEPPRDSAGIATDGSDGDEKPQAPEQAQ